MRNVFNLAIEFGLREASIQRQGGPPLCEEITYTGNDFPTLLCLANEWATYLDEYADCLGAEDPGVCAEAACVRYKKAAEKCLSNP